MSCGCVKETWGSTSILNELGVSFNIFRISGIMQWMSVQTGAAAANTAGMILAVPAAPPAEFVEDIGQRAPPVLQSPHGRSACMHEAVRHAPGPGVHVDP